MENQLVEGRGKKKKKEKEYNGKKDHVRETG